MSPSGWIVLKNPIGAGGNILRPSSRQAFMYGRSSSVADRVISSSELNLVLISFLTFSKHLGLRSRKFVSDARELAVVSEPATLAVESVVYSIMPSLA
jgi:hypothetical protein